MDDRRSIVVTFVGALLVLLGALSGLFGMAFLAVLGIALGFLVIVRAIFAPDAEPRERRGPGQSGPGDPGYQGRVHLGEDDRRRAG